MHGSEQISNISDYWNEHIHDLAIAHHPVGSAEFFEELDSYRFDKLNYLPRLVDFTSYQGLHVLEVGCGVGIDLVYFARGDATVTGIDLSQTAINLAQKNFSHNGLLGQFCVMNGETLAFEDNQFDVVYAHGVLQYTQDPQKMVDEIYRVLRPSGEAILMVYNRYSWLNLMSRFSGLGLEHEDAPAFHLFSINEFKQLLASFEEVRLLPERFPVKTCLHRGLKATLYNGFFVGLFNVIPRSVVRPFGWHIMAFASKPDSNIH